MRTRKEIFEIVKKEYNEGRTVCHSRHHGICGVCDYLTIAKSLTEEELLIVNDALEKQRKSQTIFYTYDGGETLSDDQFFWKVENRVWKVENREARNNWLDEQMKS